MLVLCVGMYRACSTWQYGVVGAILEKHRGGQRLGFVEGTRFAEKVDADRRPAEWAVLKAHDAHDRFGELLQANQAMGLYAYRDLRDVVFSYMHKTGTDFETLMERGFVDLCLGNDRFWRAQPGMLVQNYDALIADPARGVAEIADHLGVPLEPGEAEAIAAALSWEANRREVESLSARLVAAGTTLSAEDQSRFDPVSLLHWNHIRPADPGGGSKRGTPRQHALIEQNCRAWLVAHGFEVGAEAPPDQAEPVIRTSYAPGGVDVRLDRLFRSVKGTVVDFDAICPQVANASHYFYLRGWRGINVGTTEAARDRFVIERPNDLNVAIQLGTTDQHGPDPTAAPRFAGATLATLIAAHRLMPPDVVVFNQGSAIDRLLDATLANAWRPKVYVINQPSRPASGWRDRLDAAGYLAVPGLVGPAIFVRVDMAEALATLARPLGPDDHYQAADWGTELPLPTHPAHDAAATASQRWDELCHAWQAERTMFQAERDSWQRERDAVQRERDDRQRERDAAKARLDQTFAGLQAAVTDRDRWLDRARAERRRFRFVVGQQQVLDSLVTTLRTQVVEQVDLRERHQAEATQLLAEIRLEAEVARDRFEQRAARGLLGRVRTWLHGAPRPSPTEPGHPVAPRSRFGSLRRRTDGAHPR